MTSPPPARPAATSEATPLPSTSDATGSWAARLRERTTHIGIADAHRLTRRIDAAARRDPGPGARAELEERVASAERAVATRRAAVPQLSYPEDLPVSGRREDIAAALASHQVVVMAGETGSGKTTQLPKVLLEAGFGVRGTIGHTQPRRIAARSVAERIAEELGTELGDVVGYQVRFTDQSSDRTLVTLMTDGILLARIRRDPDLLAYDAIIVDEAHERSLNVDFLLGYLKRLLPRRPDLKVVITSATIDPGRFSRHFDDAPVIEVSGRGYPVEIRYRPLAPDVPVADEDDPADEPVASSPAPQRVEPRDLDVAVCDAVDELAAQGPGDVLVFLSGEREIRDVAETVRGHTSSWRERVEVLPLYARLSAAEQHRVFARHSERRIVLATNVAETSLTVPGIRYVVDGGTARISRYSTRTKVQRLPIEPVSQASARQRSGRCGRVAPGVCIRLYSQGDFEARPAFTEPEIQRTNLASVILSMADAGLGQIEDFPFVDPPDSRQIRDGTALLHELGALTPDPAEPAAAGRRGSPGPRPSAIGRVLATLPVDPRLGRMVVEADRRGCLAPVLVVVAALSLQDVRERPADKREAADQFHRRFADERSDFAAYLNLWRYLNEQRDDLSGSAFRRMCRTEFLHYLRVREWQDLHSQLRRAAKQAGMDTGSGTGEEADSDAFHQSVLAGLLSQLGLLSTRTRDYQGTRGSRFVISPGSAIAKKPPAWVMAAELVETNRLWARGVARIDPLWAEELGAHLVTRQHAEPHWSAKRGSAVARERVLLFGLPLVTDRLVPYHRIDPVVARELFIRHALVQGEWRTHHRFYTDNVAAVQRVRDLEERARRRDLVVDEEDLVAFYDARVPAEVVSVRHFDTWWKRTRRQTPDLLTLTDADLLRPQATVVDDTAYPDRWQAGDLDLSLDYRFDPGTGQDGVSVRVPLDVLAQLPAGMLGHQVPGLRLELVTALLRSLPKPLRVKFVPVPDRAKAVVNAWPDDDAAEPVTSTLARLLVDQTGVSVRPEDFDPERVPAHLRVTYEVEDAGGAVVARGKDLSVLAAELGDQARSSVAAVVAADGLERSGLTDWPVDDLPEQVERRLGGRTVRGWPTLTDEGDTAGVVVAATEDDQRRRHLAGTIRLLLCRLPDGTRRVVADLPAPARLSLGQSPYASTADLLQDCRRATIVQLLAIGDRATPVRTRAGFDRLVDEVGDDLPAALATTVAATAAVLDAWRVAERTLRGTSSLTLLPVLADTREQVADLMSPGFVSRVGAHRLPHLRRWLLAAAHRVERAGADPRRDATLAARVRAMRAEYDTTVAAFPASHRTDDDVVAVRWMLEELRVSLFAQHLGTAHPVSEQRIRVALKALRARSS